MFAAILISHDNIVRFVRVSEKDRVRPLRAKRRPAIQVYGHIRLASLAFFQAMKIKHHRVYLSVRLLEIGDYAHDTVTRELVIPV